MKHLTNTSITILAMIMTAASLELGAHVQPGTLLGDLLSTVADFVFFHVAPGPVYGGLLDTAVYLVMYAAALVFGRGLAGELNGGTAAAGAL